MSTYLFKVLFYNNETLQICLRLKLKEAVWDFIIELNWNKYIDIFLWCDNTEFQRKKIKKLRTGVAIRGIHYAAANFLWAFRQLCKLKHDFKQLHFGPDEGYYYFWDV